MGYKSALSSVYPSVWKLTVFPSSVSGEGCLSPPRNDGDRVGNPRRSGLPGAGPWPPSCAPTPPVPGVSKLPVIGLWVCGEFKPEPPSPIPSRREFPTGEEDCFTPGSVGRSPLSPRILSTLNGRLFSSAEGCDGLFERASFPPGIAEFCLE